MTFAVNSGPYIGAAIPFHYVTFLPKDNKGAGMAVHFLKTIGQPYEGKYKVDHLKWRGKILKADVEEEEYNGYINNKITAVEAVEEAKKEDVLEEVPF